jgi:small neutral amino acid transporter SnatA (MarC family)
MAYDTVRDRAGCNPLLYGVMWSLREVATVHRKETALKFDVLPLAFTMLAGPQIMSAIIFVTANKPLQLSAYFLAGVVIAVTVGVAVTHALANLVLILG